MLSYRSILRNTSTGRLRRNAVASRIAGEKMMAAFTRLQTLVLTAKFNPDQPRGPAGSSDGGQWGGGSGDGSATIDGLPPGDAVAAITSRALRAICEAQFERDIFSAEWLDCDPVMIRRINAMRPASRASRFRHSTTENSDGHDA